MLEPPVPDLKTEMLLLKGVCEVNTFVWLLPDTLETYDTDVDLLVPINPVADSTPAIEVALEFLFLKKADPG